MIRRQFLKTTAMAAAASFALPDFLSAGPKYPKKLIGLQLYSVREDMKKDPLGTLKALSAMGYRYVEHANYINRKFYGYTPKEFKKILDDLGLKMPSGHTVFLSSHFDKTKNAFTDGWKYTVEDAAYLGQQFVISPSMENHVRRNADELKHFMELFNKNGELCQQYGMKFGYHNHDFEFSEKHGDRTLFDIILGETDPKLVMQQLDMGNMYNGGGDALDIVTRYPGRFESWHVKDEILASGGHEKYESTLLGTGIVPVKKVLDIAVKAGGPNHFIVEQESYQGLTPLESMKRNLALMKDWL
jgi:sugar phosphate isomerase/epimerase